MVTGAEAPTLPGMNEVEEIAADLWATGLSAARHPTEFVRERADGARGRHRGRRCASCPTARWSTSPAWSRTVSNRRPSKGVVFINLEDETGLVNVICTPDVWKRFRKVARTAPALEIRGLLETLPGRHQRARASHRRAPARPHRPAALPRLPLTAPRGFARTPARVPLRGTNRSPRARVDVTVARDGHRQEGRRTSRDS